MTKPRVVRVIDPLRVWPIWRYGELVSVEVDEETVVECEWCKRDVTVSVNWECGHACAMCDLCFGDEDNERGWSMDIMAWDQSPSMCPQCAG